MDEHGDQRVERAMEEELIMQERPGQDASDEPIAEGTSADHAAEARVSEGGGLSADEVESRSVLAASVERSVFPATRDELLESARRMDASAAVKDRLAALPDGTFEHLEAVWEALGGDVEFRG